MRIVYVSDDLKVVSCVECGEDVVVLKKVGDGVLCRSCVRCGEEFEVKKGGDVKVVGKVGEV
jgi:DNA-directed RNA polymerase subunit RPC12/RpoP